ncbi:pilus assembly protein TadG-related protein [Sphingopyxis sp.]|uniref:pilus assembly protein TadG-related protein n=1 Tax=Sphingopyxis sp. TaxID=1908224 RepID=UPI003D128744
MTKIFPKFRPAAAAARFMTRLKSDQKGGVYIILGFAIIPLTFILGFGIDYARAMSLQTKLNAAADAAALAAVAPQMILQSNGQSKSAATNMFNAQASLETGYRDLKVTPVVTDGTPGSNGALGFLRKATVSYSAKSINMFGGILGADTLTVRGTSTASAAQPPNVDFYLAMDNSPSMLLPSTSDGIAKIIAATKSTSKPSGCAFACHAMVPKSDGIYVRDTSARDILLSTGYYTAGSGKQNVWYRYKTSSPVELFDSTGTTMNSSSTATGTTTTNGKTGDKRVDTRTDTVTATKYTITNDNNNGPVTINKVVTTTPTTYTTTYKSNGSVNKTTTSQGTVVTDTTTHDTGYWADGYWLTHNYGLIYGSPSKIVLRKDDVVSAATQLIPFASNQAAQYHVTYQAQMFSFDWTRPGGTSPVRQLNSLTNVSSYGGGFSAASIFPADDYWWKNSEPTKGNSNDDKATDVGGMLTVMQNTIPAAGSGAPGATPQKILFIITDGMLDQPNGSGRYFGPMRTGTNSEIAKCTAIKAKGIKIAILYTQYLPESLVGDSWSQTNIAPFLPAPPSPYPNGNAGSSDKVLEKLQSCASLGTNGSPLVQTVTANDNITTALQQLFSTALQTARLVQ